jgi:hypothetical protein
MEVTTSRYGGQLWIYCICSSRKSKREVLQFEDWAMDKKLIVEDNTTTC